VTPQKLGFVTDSFDGFTHTGCGRRIGHRVDNGSWAASTVPSPSVLSIRS
jgi:hypothetical protein